MSADVGAVVVVAFVVGEVVVVVVAVVVVGGSLRGVVVVSLKDVGRTVEDVGKIQDGPFGSIATTGWRGVNTR